MTRIDQVRLLISVMVIQCACHDLETTGLPLKAALTEALKVHESEKTDIRLRRWTTFPYPVWTNRSLLRGTELKTTSTFTLTLPHGNTMTMSDRINVQIDGALNWFSQHEVLVIDHARPPRSASYSCRWVNGGLAVSSNGGPWRKSPQSIVEAQGCFRRSAGLFQGLLKRLSPRLKFNQLSPKTATDSSTEIFGITAVDTAEQSTSALPIPMSSNGGAAQNPVARHHFLSSHGVVTVATGRIVVDAARKVIFSGDVKASLLFQQDKSSLPATFVMVQSATPFVGTIEPLDRVLALDEPQRIERRVRALERILDAKEEFR
ncbi:MAG: hypothetical protein VX589_14675 [Myxococcota bacterium]|nr:hypothetical protein [Myxococcota bacterium]